MRFAPFLDPRRTNVMVILFCLLVVAAVTWMITEQMGGHGCSLAPLICRKQLKDLYGGLAAYKADNGHYPKLNGKEFITILYHDRYLEKPDLLKCAGEGATGDSAPDVQDLIFSFREPDSRGKDNLHRDFRRNRDWAPGTISYWGASGDSENPGLSDTKWSLARMLAPDTATEKAMSDLGEEPGPPSTPLVGDDNDGPQNHDGYSFILFANGKVRKFTQEWDERKWPFACLSPGR